MPEDYDLREAVEKLVEDKGADGDLPRIVVEDDRIVVEEGDWVKRDVVIEEGSEDLSDGDIEKFLKEDVAFFPEGFVRDVESEDLEELVGGEDVETEKKGGVLYDANEDFQELYEGEAYDSGGEIENYEAGVSSGEVVSSMRDDSGEFESEENIRRGGRSMLEIAGFRDEEAEKKRKRKREDFI